MSPDSAGRPPVIVLGSGITALGVIRILARNGLPAFSTETSDPLVIRSRWHRPMPPGAGKVGEGSLGDWLARSGVERAVLMPCSDHWVAEVAKLDPKHRERFPSSVPTPQVLERFVDKGHFAALLRETATPHPFSRVVDSEADLATVPDAVFSSAILKPRDSQSFFRRFGVKALHVSSRADAAEQLAALRAEGFPVILQEYVPGPATQHYFVDGFVDRTGVVRATFVRQRLRMYPLDFGNSTYMVSVRPEAAAGAVAAITRLLTHAAYRGMFSAEFKLDPRDGVFKILEVNARAWWYVDFAARCGVDVCRMAYEDALERPVAEVTSYRVGRRLVFPYSDYFACVALHQRGQLSRTSWLRSWLGAMQPVFLLRDPAPSTRASTRIIASFLGSRLRRLVSRS
jgi:predicted ATP-grasp superfamily ATP-dependent carboligase